MKRKTSINCHIAKNRGGETDLNVTPGFEKSIGNWTTANEEHPILGKLQMDTESTIKLLLRG